MKIPTTLDRKNNKLRFFTFALAVWLLIAAMPISAFAELLELETQPMGDQTVYVLAEDTTKRNEFEKHYYCSDGTFVAVTYPEAVHYKDENGEWVDVDMRLAGDAQADTYESQSGDFKTVFRAPGTSGDVSVMTNGTTAATPAISMQSGDHSLSWSLSGTKFAAPAGTSTYSLNPNAGFETVTLSASDDAQIQVLGDLKTSEPAVSVEKVPVTDPDAFALPAASNQVIYEDVFGADQNVSVRYSVSMNKIEEDILINAPTEMTSFSMQVVCGELTPVLNSDNSVDFVDELGNMVYHVSIPYLVDAAFAVNYDVAVTLTEQDGVCTITYTPDAEWMNAPEREYPIMLDPAVTTSDYTTAIVDTYVESNTEQCYYSNQFLYINENDGAQRMALMHITSLPNIDPSMPIISAKLDVTALASLYSATSVDLKLEALHTDLNLLMVKYSDVANLVKTEVDQYTFTNTSPGITYDLTSCITDWYNDNLSGYFAISLAEDFDLFVPPIYSSEYSVVSLRPRMSITYGYSLPAGLAAGEEVTIQNVFGNNNAGYLYPNSGLVGNGNLVLHAPGTTTSDNYKLLTLRQNTANGTYRLEYTPSSNSTGVYVSADTTTNKVVMYNSTNVPSNIKQDWLIVPVSEETFKIVLASDMRYVMTTVGVPKEYISDTANATSGYVSITQCMGEPTTRQQWKIYKGGESITNEISVSTPLDTNLFYINNLETGKFVSYNTDYDSLGAIGGKVEDIGVMIAWKITKLSDGYYTIQNAYNLDEYLAVLLGTVTTATCGETIPSAYKWRIEATSEYYYIKNVGANKYLYANTDESSSLILGVQTGYTADVSKWSIISKASYVELENVSFEELFIVEGGDSTPHLESIYPSNANFVESINDFSFYISSSPSTISLEGNEITAGNVMGKTEITAIHKATSQEFVFDVHSVPIFASELTTTGIVDYNHIVCTDDGFYMLDIPLSELFLSKNIEYLFDIIDQDGEVITEEYPVELYYDDWYLYAVKSSEGLVYSLIKMREQEHDGGDWDNPGVTVCFVDFNYNCLTNLLLGNTSANIETIKNYCCLEIDVTIQDGTEYNAVLQEYFSKTESKAAYLIAEKYIETIVYHSYNQEYYPEIDAYALGYIEIPEVYIELLERRTIINTPTVNDPLIHRLPDAIDHLCDASQRWIYDAENDRIIIFSPNNLTDYEKRMILITHTANENFNSFAAEVEYHADKLVGCISEANIPGLSEYFYGRALRAEMGINIPEIFGDEEINPLFFLDYDVCYSYYWLDSSIVNAQEEAHGVR